MRREADKQAVSSKKFPFGKITAGIGAVAGIVSILAFGGSALDKADEYIVTTQELTSTIEDAKELIIAEIQKEAVVTREALLDVLDARKKILQKDLEDAETSGEVAKVLEELKELNKRINRIKGIE